MGQLLFRRININKEKEKQENCKYSKNLTSLSKFVMLKKMYIYLLLLQPIQLGL